MCDRIECIRLVGIKILLNMVWKYDVVVLIRWCFEVGWFGKGDSLMNG